MEQDYRKFEPFPIAPLKMRGVFGIAWQIYKRGFWGMLLLTVLLVGIVPFIAGMSYASVFTGISFMDGNFGEQEAMRMAFGLLSGVGVMWLLGTVTTFLLSPMYQGTAYGEFSRRMRGESRSVGALFSGIGKGLTRYYTTFLANLLVQFGLSIAMSIVIWLLMFAVIMGSAFSFAASSLTSIPNVTGLVVTIVLVFLVTLVVAVLGRMFLAFVYPVAVNEGKKHFQAIGRSFRLVGRRFWRVFSTTLLYNCIITLIMLLFLLPGLLILIPAMLTNGAGDMGGAMLLICIGSVLVGLLIAPYEIALNTTLYYDTVARDEKEPRPFDANGPILGDLSGAEANRANPTPTPGLYDATKAQPQEPAAPIEAPTAGYYEEKKPDEQPPEGPEGI